MLEYLITVWAQSVKVNLILNISVFWDVIWCSLVDTHQGGETRGLITLMMEAVSSSRMSVNVYQPTQWNNPDDSFILITTRTSNLIWFLNHIHRNFKQRNAIITAFHIRSLLT